MNFSNKKALILSLPMILAIFLLGGWFLFREQKVSEESPKPPVVVENLPEKAEGREPSLESYLDSSKKEFESKKDEISSNLNFIRNDELSFPEKKGNIDFFQKTFDFSDDPWMNFNVLVYDYRKGASYSEAYEGLRWTVQLDDHVRTFQSLKPGIQEAVVIGHLGDEKTLVDFRKIGSQYYEVYDLGFKPGGNYTRYYVTFDEKRSRFVLLTFSYAFYSQEYSMQGEQSDNRISYPKEIQDFLFEIEQIIESS